jgi:hypothetical protein
MIFIKICRQGGSGAAALAVAAAPPWTSLKVTLGMLCAPKQYVARFFL